jgi:oxygen-independent coproporphyrinogen III oxidase
MLAATSSAVTGRSEQVADLPPHMPPHVYVHVPFCARRCSYCDFSIAVRRRVPVDRYVLGIEKEMSIRFHPDGKDWLAKTLYLGGGTPSLLGPDGVDRLMNVLRSRIRLEPSAEVTLEANPDDVTEVAAVAWRRSGINRISIGAQSFDARALEWMHRTHTVERIRHAVDAARAGGIDNVSVDLIFALPTALGRSWPSDLEAALALEPDHISLYGLTIEPKTAVARWVDRQMAHEAPEELYEGEYMLAANVLAGAGFEHYEVSNFARPGRRARHNGAYWSGTPYLGVGPAAHGFNGKIRRWNEPSYAAWLDAVAAGRDPVAGSEHLSQESEMVERAYLELRTTDGTVLKEGEHPMAERWVEAGWARLDDGRIRLSSTGWLRLDALALALANVRSRCYF